MTDLQQRHEGEPERPREPAPRRWRARVTDGVAGGYSPTTEKGGALVATAGQQRRSLAVLGLAVLLIAAASVAGNVTSAVLTVVVIAAVIMLHELGHFTAAKLGGMKVTEYFLGFGPRLWSIRKGETEYGVKAIPAGGYVRIIGMNNLEKVDPADEPRSYRAQSFPRRLAVAVAGSTVHFLLALVSLWALFAVVGVTTPVATVHRVVPIVGGSPASMAGLVAGDRIISYDGHPGNDWTAFHTYIEDHAGVPVRLTVSRGGQTVLLTATPTERGTVRDDQGPLSTPSDHKGFLGIEPGTAKHYHGVLGSVPHAVGNFWSAQMVGTFKGIGALFGPKGLANIGHQVVAKPGPASVDSGGGNRPVSVIGIVQIAGQLPDFESKLRLFIAANVFVGVLNLFPLLPFDGGHVVIAVYERIRSRRGRRYTADVAKMLPYAFAVVIVLGFIFVSSLYLDIAHPITFH
ncbi:MAG: M50 family metallopeptidase [Acidimicrobiales bacterium]